MSRLSCNCKTSKGRVGILGILTFPVIWGLVFFIIGLFYYREFDAAVMIGVCAFVYALLSLAFIIPFAIGIVLWFLASFTFDWIGTIASVMDLKVSTIVAWAWYVPSIIYFVVGIVFTVFILLKLLGYLK